ncbi:alpha/beta hydrolase-fold protein [Verrucomicrobiota bacterium]
MMMDLVFLPATEPDNDKYGVVPEEINCCRSALIHTIQYPNLVWYNGRVRAEAIAQIRAFNVSPVVLVGFSKSGLGAWNIARTIPDLISGTIIFDAPVARASLPPWGTGPFYEDDSSWQEDLPLRTIDEFRSVMPKAHQLVLISGEGFHDEMCQFSDKLAKSGCRHTFLSRPRQKHRWDSGWIEEGLSEVIEPSVPCDA